MPLENPQNFNFRDLNNFQRKFFLKQARRSFWRKKVELSNKIAKEIIQTESAEVLNNSSKMKKTSEKRWKKNFKNVRFMRKLSG